MCKMHFLFEQRNAFPCQKINEYICNRGIDDYLIEPLHSVQSLLLPALL